MNMAYNQNQQRPKPASTNSRQKPFVEVKLVTWNKDSHGLFDYESKSVDLKYIHVETPCEIYRLRKDTTAESQREKEEFRIYDKSVVEDKDQLTQNNSIFLVSIENFEQMVNSGKFSLNVFRDSLKTLPNNQLAQDPYLIVRSLKNETNIQKGYDLKVGDIVKFGRIEYQVVQLKNAGQEPQVKHIEKHIFHQPDHIETEGVIRTCKICLAEDENDEDFFCNPCECKGSCEYVHVKCIRNWIQSKLKCKTTNTTQVYSWKKSDCELCKSPLPKHINYKNKLYDLLDLQVPKENPYIVLESIAKEKKVVKTLFLFQATQDNQEIKLGRGHLCEVRISDISVSRTHSFIKFQKGKFTIFDNISKFGTLIKMNNDIEINSEKKAVQIGRTVVTFALKYGPLLGGNMFQEKTDNRVPVPPYAPQAPNQANNPVLSSANTIPLGSETEIASRPANNNGNVQIPNQYRFNQQVNLQNFQQQQLLPSYNMGEDVPAHTIPQLQHPFLQQQQQQQQQQPQQYDQYLNRNGREPQNKRP